VVGGEEVANILRIEPLGAGRETDEVDEEHGDDPPLLSGPARLDERGAAGTTEPGAVRILVSASCAGRHDVED
jgi:hypothetical protein